MGVYIIWYWDRYTQSCNGQSSGKVRLSEAMKTPSRRNYAQSYANFTLYVTWDEVTPLSDRKGVENYLGNLLHTQLVSIQMLTR